MPLTIPPLLDLFAGALDPRMATATSVTPQSANAVHYVSFQVRRAQPISTVYFRVGNQNGNVDMGIYVAVGTAATRLVATGSFAVPAAGVKQSQALAAAGILLPGTRYLQALAADGVTAGFGGLTAAAMAFPSANREHIGIISSSFPLPSTLDLSTAADTGKMFCLLFA